jgi:hypothetical protein
MKNKIVFFGVIIMLFTAFGNAKPIELTITPATAKLNAGSSVEFTVIVKNTEGVNQDMGASVSGSASTWAALSESQFTLPAMGEKKLIVTLKPSAAAPAGEGYDLTITASTMDGQKWDTKTIGPISIAASAGGLRGYHEQPTPPVPVTTTIPPEPPSGPFLSGGVFGLNLYYEPKMTTDRGYNLMDGDQICVGDTVTVSSSGSGEFFGKGAADDSPPIVFVENLQDTINEINAGKYTPKTYPTAFCAYWLVCRGRNSSYKDDPHCRCLKYAAVICESPCKTSNFGRIEEINRQVFKVSDAGIVESYATCVPNCIMYYEEAGIGRIGIGKPGSEWYAGDAGGNAGRAEISSQTFLNAVKGTRGPDLRVVRYSYNNVDGKLLIRAEIKNQGDLNAVLDSTTISIPGCEILYRPKEISPGEETEMLLSCEIKETSNLKATLEYSSEKVGCTTTKNFKGTFPIGGCKANANCDDKDTCTTDSCSKAGTAISYCSNKGICENTDTSCGCTTCDNCNKMDWKSECSWTCADPQTRKCARTAKDYYCSSSKTCRFTSADESYTEKCPEGGMCSGGVCGAAPGCEINDGTWSRIASMPSCGVKDTNKDGYYDVSCCDGTVKQVQIRT